MWGVFVVFVFLGVFYSPVLFFPSNWKCFIPVQFVCLAVVYCGSLFRSIPVVTTSEFHVGGGAVFPIVSLVWIELKMFMQSSSSFSTITVFSNTPLGFFFLFCHLPLITFLMQLLVGWFCKVTSETRLCLVKVKGFRALWI